PRGLRAQRHESAAAARIADVPGSEVEGGNRHERLLPAFALDSGVPLAPRVPKGARARLRRQVLLRAELSVEAAVGEPGILHQVRHADAVEAALAEQPCRRLEDALPV